MINLQGKKALIVGVANDQSIAWGVARAMRAAGADLALTHLNEKAERHVRPLSEQIGADLLLPLDVQKPEEERAVFAALQARWGRLDVLVHSIAFAPLQDLHGRVCDATPEGFALAMDVSVHSFIRLVRLAEPLMHGGGACVAMSYLGAQKVVSTYNVMGPVKAALEAVVRELASELGPANISVNALSPGPIATRAAGGIDKFEALMTEAIKVSPMGRLATIEEVGAAAAFLASDAARPITGSVIHVDCGRHIMA
jgi:enoyl-[acyl-carrier protein] reductase I